MYSARFKKIKQEIKLRPPPKIKKDRKNPLKNCDIKLTLTIVWGDAGSIYIYL